jgi:hypothetical protein
MYLLAMAVKDVQTVQKFLDEMQIKNQEQYTILQKLREIVHTIYPDVSERMMYGGIMFSLDEDFGGIFASTHHVSFEFGKGYLMHDPKQVLEGTGKSRRHLKLSCVEDIVTKEVEFFVKQAI